MAKTAKNAGGHKVIDKSNYGDVPECIYFYYINPYLRWPMRVYYAEIPKGKTIKKVVQELADNAVDDEHSPPPCGWSLGDLRWRRRSYLAMVVDDPNERVNPDDPAIFDIARGQSNHTFLDGEYVDITAGKSKKALTGFWCINHLKKDEKGGELGDDEKQAFSIAPNSPSARQAMAVLGGGDSGTNMGPPVPPPGFLLLQE